MTSQHWSGYRVRGEVTKDFLRGRGLELGAGGSPQILPAGVECLYFDKNAKGTLTEMFKSEITYTVHPVEAIPEFFPNGADFLIAHNVLEHTPSEIRALIGWHQYVRNGGIVVLSVPDKRHCLADSRRLVANGNHLFADYLFGRDEFSFESLEHVYSFLANWHEAKWDENHKLTKDAFVDKLLTAPYEKRQDFHFHALDQTAWDRVVAASALFGDRGIRIRRIVNTETTPEKTDGEIIYIYEVGEWKGAHGLPDIAAELLAFRRVLQNSVSAIDRAIQRPAELPPRP